MMFLNEAFSALATMAGFAGVLTLVGLIYMRDAVHWRYLAKSYRRNWRTPIRERYANAVLYGKYPVSKAYNGILKVGIHTDGLALRIGMPPHSFFCEPLFIPFKDVRGWDQTWYLNAKTVELELKHAPEVKMVMPRDQVEWIRDMGGNQIELADQPSPHKDKPVIWRTFLVAWPIIAITSLVFVLFFRNQF